MAGSGNESAGIPTEFKMESAGIPTEFRGGLKIMHKKEWPQGRGAIALNEVQCVAAIRNLIKYLVDAASCIHSSWFFIMTIALEIAASGRFFDKSLGCSMRKIKPILSEQKTIKKYSPNPVGFSLCKVVVTCHEVDIKLLSLFIRKTSAWHIRQVGPSRLIMTIQLNCVRLENASNDRIYNQPNLNRRKEGRELAAAHCCT
jgi:hypothetical protein